MRTGSRPIELFDPPSREQRADSRRRDREGAAPVTSHRFSVDARDDGDGVRIEVSEAGGPSRRYLLPGRESQHYFAFFRDLHRDFGTRLPHFFTDPATLPELRRSGTRY